MAKNCFRPYVACRLHIVDSSLLRGRVRGLVSLGCFDKLYYLQAGQKDLMPQPFHKNLLLLLLYKEKIDCAILNPYLKKVNIIHI